MRRSVYSRISELYEKYNKRKRGEIEKGARDIW